MKKTNAFTLAEVLITLVIIGVIAAMTIPTLMGSTNQQEIKSKLKKGVSALNQAFALEYALYGQNVQTNYATIGEERISEILQNHLSIIKIDRVNEDDEDRIRLTSADGFMYEIYGGGAGINLRVDSESKNRILSFNCQGSPEEAENCKPNTFSLNFCQATSHSVCANDGLTYAYLYDMSMQDAFNAYYNN